MRDPPLGFRLVLRLDQPVAQITLAVSVQLLFVPFASLARANHWVALPEMMFPGSL